MTLNSQKSACLCLLSTEILALHHFAWLEYFYSLRTCIYIMYFDQLHPHSFPSSFSLSSNTTFLSQSRVFTLSKTKHLSPLRYRTTYWSMDSFSRAPPLKTTYFPFPRNNQVPVASQQVVELSDPFTGYVGI